MMARYKGAIVKVLRIKANRATIVYQGMLKRVNTLDLEDVIDTALIATFVGADQRLRGTP